MYPGQHEYEEHIQQLLENEKKMPPHQRNEAQIEDPATVDSDEPIVEETELPQEIVEAPTSPPRKPQEPDEPEPLAFKKRKRYLTVSQDPESFVPPLPEESCPPELRAELSTLSYTKKMIMEKLVSTEDLQWNQVTEEMMKRLQKANTIMDIKNVLEIEVTQNGLRYLNKLGNDDQRLSLAPKNAHLNWALNAKITKDRVTFYGPFVEGSNRVTREFPPDRFMRVCFDIHDGGVTLFRKFLKSGIRFAGRNFEFLCFSASQLREHKCYFFASSGEDLDSTLTAETVRKWLGDFGSIKTLPKYAARLGQVLSRTIPTVKIPPAHLICIPDIEHNGYNFTDGCGFISPDYAEQIANLLDLKDIPSAFQIRLGPLKGVVLVNSSLTSCIQYRPSMKKFDIPGPTDSQLTVEVIRWSMRSNGYLNRQFILLFHGVGVSKEYFIKLQEQAIKELTSMTHNKRLAISHLEADDSADDFIKRAVGMLLAGHSVDEPYLRGLLESIQRSQLKSIKERAKIWVPQSRIVLGVCDPSGKLESGQVFLQIMAGNAMVVISGKVAVGKNPCVHPGDIRLLEAVNVPELKHITDCLVFPTKGERPHADEISGGDLDGDQYFITWDTGLTSITPYPPMKYSAVGSSEPVPSSPIEAMKEYFLKMIFNPSLGIVANLHVVHADRYGPCDSLSLELAELHSRAVDSAKTGDMVVIPEYLPAKKFPHFMEKAEDNSYHSTGILGVLFDLVDEYIKKMNNSAKSEIELDSTLLLPGRERYLADARVMLGNYNKEMVRAFEAESEEDRIQMLDTIRQKYRKLFLSDDKAPGYEDKLLKASAWYYVAYEAARKDTRTDDVRGNVRSHHRVTFPWNTCDDYLNRIKCDYHEQHGRLSFTMREGVFTNIALR